MPTKIVNRAFFDSYGNELTYYQSNAQSTTIAVFEVDNTIQVISSELNTLTMNQLESGINSIQDDWFDIGFRVGQIVDLQIFDASGTQTGSDLGRTVVSIDGNDIYLDDLDAVFTDGLQYTVGGALGRLVVTSQSIHDGLDVQVNHVLNTSNGGAGSLIDGENTTIRFTGLEALTIGSDITAIQVGNKSGSFACIAEITRDANQPLNTRRYIVAISVVNPGGLNEGWFTGGSCLKLYAKFKFQVVVGEPFGTLDIIHNENADTGYFNEAFNLGVSVSSIVQGVDILDYYNGTMGEFTIETPLPANFEMGGLYVPLDDNYYKNKVNSQSELCMRLYTAGDLTAGVYFSDENPDGAETTFVISTPTIVGDQYTYTFSFYGNSAWQDFIESRADGDRQYILYFNVGNENLEIFNGQLTREPLPAGVIPDISTAYYLNHSQNVTDADGIDLTGGGIAFKEDDLAMVLKFQVLRNSIYKNFIARIEAFNSVTEERFTLQETVFNMENAQVSGGKQLVNASIGQPNNLPSTSAKKIATFGLEPSLDSESKYGLKCYYPFVILWQYWQQQLNANADFYPNQNKDWLNYPTGDWLVTLYFGLANEDQLFEKRYLLPFQDYETGNTTPEITLYRADGTVCTAYVDGEIMTIEAKNTTATALNPDSIWAQIVVEPFESEPRWMISNVIGNGNDVNNPLFDWELEVIGLETFFRCKIDTNKINIQNGVSTGSRIFGNDFFGSFLLQENLDYLLQEDLDKIII